MTQSPASPPKTEEQLPPPVQIEAPASEIVPAAAGREGEAHPPIADPLKGEAHPTLAGEAGRTQQPLAAGRWLRSYEILSLLGKGGMGEVYLARDSRLDRRVALKVLPDGFTKDPERLARFEREARLLASLNHPNIAAIYGLEEADDRRFLVLELAEGETLAEWLEREPLPIETALGICRQIAEGMEAAHENGIIHRDLKPANIKITADGKVKILDFGLARAYQKEGTAADVSRPPTLTDEINGSGMIVGTADYMSPEQASGKLIDKRTDIWAFGCVLFECLTRKRAFRRETVSETVTAILKGEPDWQALPATAPRKVQDLLNRCLQKDPRERLRDIGDARIEIGEALSRSAEASSVAGRFSFRWLVASVVLLLLGGILSYRVVIQHFQSSASLQVVRSIFRLETGLSLDGKAWAKVPSKTAMVISRDGQFIVYSAVAGNADSKARPQLYLRRMDRRGAGPINGTEGGISPFLSPDGRWVGFWADHQLKRVPVDGGVPVILCDASEIWGASWGPAGKIMFSAQETGGLFSVPADGGKPEVLTTPDATREEYSHRLPYCLPDRKNVLFTIMRESHDLEPRLAVLQLKTRQWRILLEDAADGRYVSTGHLIFLRQGILMVAPFNLDRLEIEAQPVPMLSDVMQALNIVNGQYNTVAGQFSISDSGWLLYATGGIQPDMQNTLVWVDHKGTAQPVGSLNGPFFCPRVSPDGQRIACYTVGRRWDVWVYDLARGMPSRLTDQGKTTHVSWTPDGKRLVFGWRAAGKSICNLFWQLADGSSPMERLTTSEYYQRPGPCSPDGGILPFAEEHSAKDNDIYLLDLRTSGVKPFLNSRFDETCPSLSPEGSWMAYSSNESGRAEVYVRSFPGPGGKWLISSQGGTEPLWDKSGRQLFYRWRNQVWVADVHSKGGFSSSRPRMLFERPGFVLGWEIRWWDLSPDGRRFLMVKEEERNPQSVTELILVQNWFEEFKRLVPSK